MPYVEPRNHGETVAWWKRFFLRSISTQRLFLALLFVGTIAFFFHFREVRVHNLELGKTAESYVIAQVPFEFSDVEATTFLRQEVVRDVRPVYRLTEKQILESDANLQSYLQENSNWRDVFPLLTTEQMFRIKEGFKEKLIKLRLTDSRTLQRMHEAAISTESYLAVPAMKEEKEIILAPEVLKEIVDNIFCSADDQSPCLFLTGVLVGKSWTLEEDLSAQNQIRKAVKFSIPLKVTHVDAGSRIINAGEKVTYRHLDMMKAMKKVLTEEQNLITPLTVSGSLLMAFLVTAIGLFYLRVQHPDLVRSYRKLSLLATIIVLTLTIAKIAEYFILNKAGHLVEVFSYPIFVPFGTLLTALLLGTPIALVTTGFLAVVMGTTMATSFDQFMIINLAACLIGITGARKIRQRKEIFVVCLKMWLLSLPIILGFNLMENGLLSWRIAADMAVAFGFIILSAIFVIGLLPILESWFDIMTEMTLIEYIDPNHPLLRRLSVEAPGTYHHSLIVGAISEAAARAVGASGLFCRVATLYHDVGKLISPQSFTENQTNGFNLHQLLTPIESAEIILSHVQNGVHLAQQHGLPKSFISIIREHHGTSPVYCFYRAQVSLSGDPALVDIAKFRYPGPKPHSKESAIIMVGDCVEAAFRSLEQISEESVTHMVERIVTEKLHDGQFNECRLTFEELSVVKKAMVKVLLVTSHSRVKYPEAQGNERYTEVPRSSAFRV